MICVSTIGEIGRLCRQFSTSLSASKHEGITRVLIPVNRAASDAALFVIRHPESGIGLIADDFGGSGRGRLGPRADIARWLTTSLQFVRSLVA